MILVIFTIGALWNPELMPSIFQSFYRAVFVRFSQEILRDNFGETFVENHTTVPSTIKLPSVMLRQRYGRYKPLDLFDFHKKRVGYITLTLIVFDWYSRRNVSRNINRYVNTKRTKLKNLVSSSRKRIWLDLCKICLMRFSWSGK